MPFTHMITAECCIFEVITLVSRFSNQCTCFKKAMYCCKHKYKLETGSSALKLNRINETKNEF